MRRALSPALLALAAAGVWLWAGRELKTATGARLQQLGDAGPLAEHRVAGLELPRHGQQHLPWRGVRARYLAHVVVEQAGECELRLVANGSASLRLDGRELLARAAEAKAPSERARAVLGPGSHALQVDYASDDGPHVLRVLLAAPGGQPRRLDADRLFPEPPTQALQARVRRVRLARDASFVVALLAALALAVGWLPRAPAHVLARLRPLPILLVVAFAAALRLEALVTLQWQERAPLALRQLAVAMWDWHPAGLRIAPQQPGYEGDPFTYLRFAQEMRGFYDAHVREPMFVATARGLIGLLGGADVGLAAASALYSTLLVGATYGLGAVYVSRGAGLLAALCLALERRSVAFSALGWRDDAFAFFTALTLVTLGRLVQRPTFARALLAAGAAAGACLTRITALAFVVPVLALAALIARRTHGPQAGRAFALCAALAAALIAPYPIACGIAFGDPLHAINAHTVFYRERLGLPHQEPMNVARFLGYGRGPFELLDTAVLGLTSYPFQNKWADFDDWLPGAAKVLAVLAVIGLFGFAGSATGRLLLLALAASLAPYATTWDVPGGGEWRFTLHAYPFYLVAAFWALTAPLRPADRRRLGFAALAAAIAVPCAWFLGSGLQYLRVREQVARGRPATVYAGHRDAFLLARGWGGLERFENGVARETSAGRPAVLRLPLAEQRASRLTLRLRPAATCGVPCVVEVAHYGRVLARATLEVGGADAPFSSLEVPLDAGGAGNELELRGGPVALWLARVEPLGS